MICKHCGNEIIFSFTNNESLRKNQECFSCNFWSEHLTAFENSEDFFSVGGSLYWNGGEVGEDFLGYSGFGGHRWYIIKNNGIKVTTNNLWHNGEIPEIWKEKFPQNAKFVSKEEYEKENV